MSKYVYADADTWVCIYRDGKLLYGDHAVSLKRFAEIIAGDFKEVEEISFKEVNLSWLDEEANGKFPECLDEVEFW